MSRHAASTAPSLLAFATTLVAALAGVGCRSEAPQSGDAASRSAEASALAEDPLSSLRSSTASTRYTSGYWLEQGRANSPLWAQAITYCGDDARPRPGLEADGAKPNCHAVQVASFQLRDERLRRARIDSARAASRQPRDPAAEKRRLDALENTLKY